MLDQHIRMLFQIAEARRMHGTSERDGSVHQVWRKDGEQKIRINLGKRPDGSPWLSPWIKIEDHHGSSREQKKFHKGQNVKITAAGADFSQAKVTPAGENKDHPEPQHATDIHDTTQYASMRTRSGPDFEERWMASGGQVQGQDPDKIATVLKRWGAKPDNQNDKSQPWDGPDPNQASPKKRVLDWVGNPGNTPLQTGDSILKQFDKDVKTEHTSTGILNKVQSSDGDKMTSPDAGGKAQKITTDFMKDGNVLRKIQDFISGKITSTLHMNGDITHEIQDMQGNLTRITQQLNQMIHQTQSSNGDFSTILHQAGQIFHQVTSGGQTSTFKITPSAISINSKSVNVNTDSFSTPSTAPTEPAVSQSGDAPLIVIPAQQSIEAALSVASSIAVISQQKSIESALSVTSSLVVGGYAYGSDMTITPQQFDPLAGSPGYDSTSAIRAAFAAVPPGGKLYLPGVASSYMVSNGFMITKPVNVVGDGDATSFTGSLPVNTDLFHVVIPPGYMRDFSFEKMKFMLTGARSWFHIDTTAAANAYLPGLRIADILAPVSPLLHAIWVDGLATGAGLSQAEFERCQLTVDGPSPNACYMLNNVGDSIRIKDGLVTGTAFGVWLNQVPGAGSFNLDGTNITSCGGIIVQNAVEPIFENFEIELSNFDMLKLGNNSGWVSTGAGIYFISTDGATIGPGQIQAIAGSANFFEAIYLSNASANVTVDGMRLASTVGGTGIYKGAAPGFNQVNNSFTGFTNNVL